MVRIDRNTPPSQPHNVHSSQGAKGANQEPAQMRSIADRIKQVAPNTISSAGKHVYTRNAPNKSEARDVGHVAKQAINLIKQINRK